MRRADAEAIRFLVWVLLARVQASESSSVLDTSCAEDDCSCHDYPDGTYSTEVDTAFRVTDGYETAEGCYSFADTASEPPLYQASCSLAEDASCNAGRCQALDFDFWLPSNAYPRGGCYLWHGGTQPEKGVSPLFLGDACQCTPPDALAPSRPPPSCDICACHDDAQFDGYPREVQIPFHVRAGFQNAEGCYNLAELGELPEFQTDCSFT